MNRTLLCLGLANNKIGDVGANKFADVRITMAINGFANGSRLYFVLAFLFPKHSRSSIRLSISYSDWWIFAYSSNVTFQFATLHTLHLFVCVSQVLSRFQLTHEEIVERRKLMSEKGSPDGHKPVSTTARTGQGATQYWVPYSAGARTVQCAAQYRDRQTLRITPLY